MRSFKGRPSLRGSNDPWQGDHFYQRPEQVPSVALTKEESDGTVWKFRLVWNTLRHQTSIGLMDLSAVPCYRGLSPSPHTVRGKPTADSKSPNRFAEHPAPARLVPYHWAAQNRVVAHPSRFQAAFSENAHCRLDYIESQSRVADGLGKSFKKRHLRAIKPVVT